MLYCIGNKTQYLERYGEWMKRKFIVSLLIAGISCGLVGCGENAAQENEKQTGTNNGSVVNLMENIDKSGVAEGSDANEEVENMDVFCADTIDFSIELLQENVASGETNVMVSPVSVLTALAMTANGAEGETLSQMQQVIGENQTLDQMNQNMKAWTDGLVNTEDTALKIANSIWFKDEEEQIQVQEEFLQKNAAYYQADIYKAPFDESTLADINNWVSDKTEGRVTDILDKVPDEAVMYLINALAFDAEWQEIYFENQIQDGIFCTADGEEQTVSFMYGEESIYIQDDNANGFIKPYKEGYSFVAILPKEGMTPAEYIASLDGEQFQNLIDGQETTNVQTAIPKFEAEYEIQLSDILKELGMRAVFDEEKADLSSLGVSEEGNLYVNRVLHKTYISVDEKGTEAGAATAVEVACEMSLEMSYNVYLDRPFVYAIIEDQTNIPLFIGTVDSMD